MVCKVVESFDEFFFLKDYWWFLVVANLYEFVTI